MSRLFKLSIAGRVLLAVVLAFSSVQLSAAEGDEVLKLVPADSMFCIRLNNFDFALGMMDQYLAGAMPGPMMTSMMARGQLAKALNDATLENVNTAGNLAVFGIIEAGPQGGPGKPGFYGLIPMKDYKKFVSSNANCSKADGKGISTIKGVVQMGQEPMPITLIKRAGDYAIVTGVNNYDGLVATANKMKNGKCLGNVVNGGEAKKAVQSPMWIYANVDLASKMFGPFLFGKIEEVKAQVATQEGAPPPEMIDIYSKLLKILFEELESVSVSVMPKPEVLNTVIGITAKAGTGSYKGFSGGGSGKPVEFLEYLEDGAMLNMAARMDNPFWQQGYVDMMDLIGELGGGSIDPAELEELKAAAKKSIGVTGSMALTMRIEEKNGEGMMIMKEIIKVKDEKVYKEAADEMMALMNEGAISDLYKNFGIKLSCSPITDAGTYKGVSISSARMGLGAVEPEAEFGQLIETMYGGGFDYRWAVFDGVCVYAMGDDVDAMVRELIDDVKAGGPKSTGAEIQEAVGYLTNGAQADFVGTYNYVRLIKMMGSIMIGMPADAGEIAELGEVLNSIAVESKSNIAFAGTASGGTLDMEIALPKAHLMEMMQVFGAIQQHEMQKYQKQMQGGQSKL
jgi:hypothetical protein